MYKTVWWLWLSLWRSVATASGVWLIIDQEDGFLTSIYYNIMSSNCQMMNCWCSMQYGNNAYDIMWLIDNLSPLIGTGYDAEAKYIIVPYVVLCRAAIRCAAHRRIDSPRCRNPPFSSCTCRKYHGRTTENSKILTLDLRIQNTNG
mgnify:CR=1 FL=1